MRLFFYLSNAKHFNEYKRQEDSTHVGTGFSCILSFVQNVSPPYVGLLKQNLMLDTTPQITQFLKENFKPSNLLEATHKITTHQLLNLLFNVFPKGSVDDYDLYQILISLQYTPFRNTIEIKNLETEEIINELSLVWCLEELGT